VLERPTRAAGARGLGLTGHHEIMIPIIFEAVLSRMAKSGTAIAKTKP
jgi:hypothetical protein